MKNANEMRNITNEVIEARKAALIDKFNKYIDEEIEPKVESAAKSGYRLCKLTTRCDIDYDYVVKALTNLGYEIEYNQHFIIVHW